MLYAIAGAILSGALALIGIAFLNWKAKIHRDTILRVLTGKK